MRNTNARRLKLLKLEARGFSESEIVKALAEEFGVTKRTVQYDLQKRGDWQSYDTKDLLLLIINRYMEIYRFASVNLYKTDNPSAQIGWTRVMLDATQHLADFYELPRLKRQAEQLREQIGKGVYICPEKLRAYSKTSRRK